MSVHDNRLLAGKSNGTHVTDKNKWKVHENKLTEHNGDRYLICHTNTFKHF